MSRIPIPENVSINNPLYADEGEASDHLKLIEDYPVPRTKDQVKSFLGMPSCFRQYVPKYADRVESRAKLMRITEVFRSEQK